MIDDMESVTAKLCSFARACHSNHDREKIFDDYLAYDLMGKEEYDAMYETVSRGFDGFDAPFSRADTEQIIADNPDLQAFEEFDDLRDAIFGAL